jgi:hypothetical protein
MSAAVVALHAVLTATGAIGRTAHRLHPARPAVSDVAALFHDIPPADAATIAHAMSGARYQNRALVEIARRRGLALLRDVVDPAGVEALRPLVGGGPAILVGWHVGPPFGLAGAFEAVGLQVLLLRRALSYGTTPTLEVAPTDGGQDERSSAFRQALARLREGGVVLLAVDASDVAQTAPVPCFGRARSMARGPFALARLTGAPVLPIAAALDGDRVVRVAIGSRLTGDGEGDALEASLAAGAAAWLEGFLRRSPGQLRRCVLAWLLEAPPLSTSGTTSRA